MKDLMLQAVEEAVEFLETKEKEFESTAQYLKARVDDPCVNIAIARETLNFFRTTRDLEKTKKAFMEMRRAKFEKDQRWLMKKSRARLTIHDGIGFFKKP